MKKILAFLLTLVLMLSLIACNADTSSNINADIADVCHECGKTIGAEDEAWLSAVSDENGNMIDVYICDDCWKAEQNAGNDANADEPSKGGYNRVPQNGADNDSNAGGDSYTCSVCHKEISLDDACMEANSSGVVYFCSDCFDKQQNS